MLNSSSRFWLHLDQPQRLSLQGIGVCHLEKLRLFGIAGYHTAVPTACSQVSQQCSKALHRQITSRLVCLLLEARRLRSSGRHHGVASPPVLGQLLVLEQEQFPHLPQVPLHVEGQQAQQDVGSHPVGCAMMNRARQEVDTFDTSERLLHQGQPLVRPNPVGGCQPLGGLAGSDHIDPIQKLFVFDVICFASPCQMSVAYRQTEMLRHLVMVDNFTSSHADLGRRLGWPPRPCHTRGQRFQFGLSGRKHFLALCRRCSANWGL